jgi:hypothetical protein
MPRRLPPFVECWRDRHRKVRVYFRKDRGPRIPLPNSIGSDEFNVAYQAALAGQLAPVRERHARAAAGTIGALMEHYKQSAAYIGASPDDQARLRIADRSSADPTWASNSCGPHARAHYYRHSPTLRR